MTDYLRPVVCYVLSVACATGLVLASSPAAASIAREAPRQARVTVADLNLAHPAGRATFERRAAAAASAVCAAPAGGLRDKQSAGDCRRSAIEQARRAISLTAALD